MNKGQKTAIGASIVGSVLLGGAIGTSVITSASAATDTPSDSSTSAPAEPNGPRDGGARHGRGHMGDIENLLTGDTAVKVTAAVAAEHPDARIRRVEKDDAGTGYEAHIIQADGTRATVKMDKSFAVTSTETGQDGHGPRPHADDTDTDTDTGTESGTESGS